MDLTEKKTSGELIYDGIIVHLYKDSVTLPDGNAAIREVIRHQGAVCVVPITDNGYVYMVKQFRYPFGKVLLEIPAGKLDKGEIPEDAARRELKEETGLKADKLIYMGELYTSPAFVDEIIHMYLATGLTQEKQNLDEDEFIEVEKIHIDKLVEAILSGEIKDAKTQTALLKAKHFIVNQ